MGKIKSEGAPKSALENQLLQSSILPEIVTALQWRGVGINNSLGFSSCGRAVLSGRGLDKGWVKLEPARAKELLVHVAKTPNKNGKKHKPELVLPHAKQQVSRKFPSNQRIIEE